MILLHSTRFYFILLAGTAWSGPGADRVETSLRCLERSRRCFERSHLSTPARSRFRGMSRGPSRFIQIYQGVSRFIQMYQDPSIFIQIYPDLSRFMQIDSRGDPVAGPLQTAVWTAIWTAIWRASWTAVGDQNRILESKSPTRLESPTRMNSSGLPNGMPSGLPNSVSSRDHLPIPVKPLHSGEAAPLR